MNARAIDLVAGSRDLVEWLWSFAVIQGAWRQLVEGDPSGISVGQMRVPLGVIGIIYESRPNVTADAAGLCLKSGNAAILRGGSEALHSNQAIAACIVIATPPSTALPDSGSRNWSSSRALIFAPGRSAAKRSGIC